MKINSIKNPGRGWHGDSTRHKKSGSKGGNTTLRSYGTKYFSQIGKTGGTVSSGNFARNIERAREAGRKGGKIKKKILSIKNT